MQNSCPEKGRPGARFRLSLKDQTTGESLKLELIPAPNESPFAQNPAGRYRLRVNGKVSTKVKEANLTEIFNRLRGWLVARAKLSKGETHDRKGVG